jgi:hypothetical protein
MRSWRTQNGRTRNGDTQYPADRSGIVKRQHIPPYDLALFVALASHYHHVASSQLGEPGRDCRCTVADFACAGAGGQYGGADRAWPFAARIIVRNDGDFGVARHRRAH